MMKRFDIGLAWRIALLLGCMIALAALFWNPDFPITQALLALAIVGMTLEITRFVRRTNAELKKFLSALRYQDGSIRFGQRQTKAGFEALRQELETILGTIERNSLDQGQQDFLLAKIIDLLPVGLVVVRKGALLLRNSTASALLSGHRSADHLLTWLRALNPHEKVVTYGSHELTIQRSMFQSDGEIEVYALTEISQVNEEQEMDAYLKLIRILTHEIMNSVTSISSLSSTLLEVSKRENHDAQHIEALGSIKHRSEGLLTFVDSYRKLTDVPAPAKTWFALLPLAREVALPFDETSNLQVALSGDTSVQVHADRQQISQVIINLLLNAQHALEGHESGKIEISLSREASLVQLDIKDNGPGIEPRDLNDIFTPFFSTREAGSGIGLSLSRQIMRNNHGSVGVTSTHGDGATFVLRFNL